MIRHFQLICQPTSNIHLTISTRKIALHRRRAPRFLAASPGGLTKCAISFFGPTLEQLAYYRDASPFRFFFDYSVYWSLASWMAQSEGDS